MKKVIFIIVIILVVIIVAIFIWVRFVPLNKLDFLKNQEGPVSQVLCLYPVKVSGQSMEPLLTANTKVNFNKCFTEEDLVKDAIIVFKANSSMRLCVIREIVTQDGQTIYKVSPAAKEPDLVEVILEQIVAIYKK